MIFCFGNLGLHRTGKEISLVNAEECYDWSRSSLFVLARERPALNG